MIPFKYGSVVSKDYFCGRKELIESTKERLLSSQNIVLYGERRMGKSSLICEAIRMEKSLAGIFVDLMGVKSEEEIYKRIAKKLLEFDSKKTFYDILLKCLSNFKIQSGIDPITGLPNLSLDMQEKPRGDAMSSVFRTIVELNKHQKVVIVLDEFQDILKIKDSYTILGKLRGEIQYLDDISFVYAGSVVADMISIFTDHTSPFFKSALPVSVESLDKKTFSSFIKKRFKKGKRTISQKLINKIFEVGNMVSGDIQQLCEAIWSVSSYNDEMNLEHIEKALEIILDEERMIYERIYLDLTEFQARVLITVAKLGGNEVFSNNFMLEGCFTNTSSVKKAFNKFEKMRVLYDSNKEYKFLNPFFKLWLLRKFNWFYAIWHNAKWHKRNYYQKGKE